MKRGEKKTNALLLFGIAGLTGILLLLVLLDVRRRQHRAVSEERNDEQAFEMSVSLIPMEESEARRKIKANVVRKERIEEQATRPRAEGALEKATIEERVAEAERRATAPAAEESEAAGRFPALVASYAGAGGLRAHLMALQALGARTFVADMNEQRLVAEVDPLNWSLSKNFAPLSGMALDRSRLIDDDDNVEAIITGARSLYGYGHLVFVLLMPRAVENGILRGLNRAFERIGRPASEFVSVHGSYEHNAGSVLLSVVDARDRQGNSVRLLADIPLGP